MPVRDCAPHRGRRRRWLGLATVAAVLASCGGGSSARLIEDELGFDQEGIMARQVKVEAKIRDCMKSQGFDYVPVDPVAQRTGLTGQKGFSEDEFEKVYGYGITTLYEQKRNPPDDPNTAIRNALSAADQKAYQRALTGEFPDATFQSAVDTGEFSRLGGCTRTATETVFGGAQVMQDLVSALDELDQRVAADTRMQASLTKWAECMRGKGYDFAAPDDVDATLQRRLDAIVGPADAPKADYDRAALTTLQHDEVTTVADDKACEKKYVQSVEDKVRTEYEAVFRDQHAALLKQVPRP